MPTPTPHLPHRRQLLIAVLGAPLWGDGAHAFGQERTTPAHPDLRKRPLQFPRDLGSHPETAIEWWYVTGELQAKGRTYGFQLTFFRSRVPNTQNMHSAFAARQLIFAHAAVTDVAGQRLIHDQRIARSSGKATVDLASASETDTDVRLHNWSLARREGQYQAQIDGADFAFSLALTETQPLLLQGDAGWSRKGPQPAQASFYYSLPHLSVSGELTLAGQKQAVTGRAWLDHEWSQSLLDARAVGWDWIGMNLSDGSALTAFRLRDKDGGMVWAGGSWRDKDANQVVVFAPQDLAFRTLRTWRSPASGATYPVLLGIDIRYPSASGTSMAGPERSLVVRAVIDNQELDSRSTTGAIYWEGLSELLDANQQVIGRGYLELTGYASALRL